MLDPDAEVAQRLRQQLTDLEFKVLVTSDSDAAAQLCAQGGVRALLCGSHELLPPIGELAPGTGLVFYSDELSLETVLSCLQTGVHDCWQLPMAGEEMRERLQQLLRRMELWLTQIDEQLHTMRSELEKDQRAGQYIQLGMLPPNPMGIGHYRLRHRVEPSLILSGDFIDYFQITDRYFACYVADVSGHGASSAFVTVLLKNFSRRLRREYRVSMLTHPGEFLAWINHELIDQQIDKHVAMFFAVIDTRDNILYYSNAAHFPPAILVEGENTTTLEQKGKPLGIFPDVQFASKQVPFPQGARLVVFSDGVLDLIEAPTLKAKEQYLLSKVVQGEDLDAIWATLDTSKLGQDDVSCLLISHGQ